MNHSQPEKSPLGKKSLYANEYDKSLLYSIPRKINRDNIHVPEQLPFQGVDIWNAFELSWLNPKGKPMIAIAEIVIPCSSPNIVESKSLKLYLNSFNQTKFSSMEEVRERIQKDLSEGFEAEVTVNIASPQEFHLQQISDFEGTCLDELDIEIDHYQIDTSTFCVDETTSVEETVYSHLLKANCLVTGQPDWLSLSIKYSGAKIDHEGLLKYIVSFRNCNEFTEQCIERVFMDISKHCSPEKLSIYGRCTRRGGLDINAFRSNFESHPDKNVRLARQ
ncbi:MAG: NADPH-dependent 7-cyano-7-deazaguanine reductase QueF [Chlamydiota bacterium]